MKRLTKKLSLNKETVRVLSGRSLDRVMGGWGVGGDDVFLPTKDTCPITKCTCPDPKPSDIICITEDCLVKR